MELVTNIRVCRALLINFDMKYIDAEKLKAEIEWLKSVLADPLCSQGNILGPDWVAGGNKMLKEISSAITSLQQDQPEVDLEKEIDKWEGIYRDSEGQARDITDGSIVYDWKEDDAMCMNTESFIAFARHFYELGVNARKEK